MTRHRPALPTFVLALLFAAPAAAHDPYEVTMNATARPAQLELVVTMSSPNATSLLAPGTARRRLTPQDFSAFHARLVAAGPGLFALTAATAPLPARTTRARLTEENDVEFTLVFPRPVAGPLVFRAAFFARLGEGCGGTLDVSDTSGRHLGSAQLSTAQDSLALSLPAPSPASTP